jgi:mannose-6-phosphate isomerase
MPDNLPTESLRTAPAALYTETRPWGSFTVLLDLPHYKVKQIIVRPGQRLSLQLHHRREEHWIITEGYPQVIVGETTLSSKPGDTVFIPKETRHRIANPTIEPVSFIEVQLGTYFGEDDIVRFEDDYHRT